VSLRRSFDGGEPIRPESVGRLGGTQEERRVTRSRVLAVGTLACPRCDAPIAPGANSLAPTDGLACPFCGHSGRVRDFLSLASPARPARVTVRVAEPG